nr:retrovirus-related Pol polyprotein from transposon TNT 1-94 [Tanacetum cinerariifolium]
TLAKFFDEVGITQQFSAARTPQQNGVVERRNRTLVEAARTMLTFANLPSFLWVEAIATTCFTQNHVIFSMIMRMLESLRLKEILECLLVSFAFRIYNKRTRKIHESVNVNFDEISKMASKQFGLEPGLSNLNETGKSSNQSVSKVDEATKNDLEDLFQDFYDEYFDSSKIMKSSTTNVETSINDEVFHDVSESFQRESSSSSLNDDVQQNPEEVILSQTNTQSISKNMIPNGDEASTSHNEEVYVGQPPGFVSKQYPGHVYA